MRLCLVVLLALSVQLSASEIFPLFEVQDLTGEQQSLPQSVSGSACVLVLGFSDDSKANTQAWFEALSPSVAVRSLPVLEGAPGFVMPMILRALKKRFSKENWHLVLPIKKDRAVLEKLMGFVKGEAEDHAYLMLLDQKGKILWKGRGTYSDSLKDQMMSAKAPKKKR